jgi:4-alpha-glucanotransferase
MIFERSAGVLLHPTSLPSGTLGPDAYRFVDWLAAAGQHWWQILPLSPPDEYGSPYASCSAFAVSPALLADPAAPVSARELRSFRERHRYWIDDWALLAGDGAVADQVRFEREWLALQRYAASRGIRILGDLALYVGDDSFDALAHPELFDPHFVAGVPPDYHTTTGQLWNNPCYEWKAHRAEGYRWWIERFRRLLELVNAVRVDHFRGFVAYWAVPRGAPTAQRGSWRRGPGLSFFNAIEVELGPLPLVAEDLGVITPAVRRLLAQIDAPGMRILEYEFHQARGRNAFVNHPERCVLYTGTHDNEPLAAWWADASDVVRARVMRELEARRISTADPVWALVELAFVARARVAVVQMQDLLGLGREARMNKPGTTLATNWRWRLQPGQLDARLAARLRRLTELSGRLRGAPAGSSAPRTRRASARH